MKDMNLSYRFITGLLYPAILGGFVYEIGSRLMQDGFDSFKPLGSAGVLGTIVILILLIAQYVGDYLYSLDFTPEENYSKLRLFFDILIIISMYIGVNSLLNLDFGLDPIIIVTISLMVAKLSAYYWEKLPRNNNFDEFYITAKFFDLLFCFLYFITALIYFFTNWTPWLLAVVLFLDMLVYICFFRLNLKLKKSILRLFPFLNETRAYD